MGRSIWEPDLLLRNIRTRKRQLGEIEQDLKNLPYDRPERHRLLERMLHLQQGIPELEAEYANRTEVPSKAVAVAANLTKKSPPNEMITFTLTGDGWTAAQPGFSNVAFKNTYESIVATLGVVKIVMGQNNGNITADALRERFRDSPLYRAAGPNDWQDFADDFTPTAPTQSKKQGQPGASMPTPKHVAVRFLAKTTALTPGTIKTKLSLARKSKKRKKSQKSDSG